ncbi:MAG: hypothetical protein ND895_03710 [Pyrinomonadaceae bacterium]|nr:hypothetical protein [Pyrinomonadaceae bacterium]
MASETALCIYTLFAILRFGGGEDWEDAFYMGLDLHSSDWEALFINVLHVPRCDEFAQGDDINEFHERNRKKFEQSIPKYPMLARIFDMYEDYEFAPDELPRLRAECQEVKSETSNPVAIKALRKLIFASDEASKRGFSLMFICD